MHAMLASREHFNLIKILERAIMECKVVALCVENLCKYNKLKFIEFRLKTPKTIGIERRK
jgi:hypothetical protein